MMTRMKQGAWMALTAALVLTAAQGCARHGLRLRDKPARLSERVHPGVRCGGLLQTGQTQCDQGAGTLGACPGSPAGQDGAVLAGATRSYTDNGDGTITDNVTGLMWEKQSDDGSIHDWDNLYTWYDAFNLKIAALNSAAFAGHTDWRLPNVNELQSLINYGAPQLQPYVNAEFHTECVPGCTVTTCSCTKPGATVISYWSSTSAANGGSVAWSVDFGTGYVYAGYTVYRSSSKSDVNTVRAVRGEPRLLTAAQDQHWLHLQGWSANETGAVKRAGMCGGVLQTGQTQCDQGAGTLGACPGSPAGQDGAVLAGATRSYTDNGDGTITDNVTGLMWEKQSDDGSIHDKDNFYSWYDAFNVKIAALNSAAFAGHTDWRLPNVSELQSLHDYGRWSPAVNSEFNTNCTPGCTVTMCSCTGLVDWSSTTAMALGDTVDTAWMLGWYLSDQGKSDSHAGVRAVRGGTPCFDNVQDGDETDIDCGGSCLPCADGQQCKLDGDCESHVCHRNSLIACVFAGQCGGTCAPPRCNDHVQNGNETGVDCGGSCPPCPGQASRCDDGVKNGDETDVDCGGSCSPCSCEKRQRCIMFVTSTSQSGDMGGLRGADATCNSRAAIGGLAGRYQAWLCDGLSSPDTRSLHANVPYVRIDGAIIALDWTDLTDGSIANPINRDEFGNDVSAVAPFLPWTNVTSAGTCDDQTYISPGTGPCPAFSRCKMNCANDGADNGWTTNSALAQGTKGDINATSSIWTDGASGLCSVPPERIYCIEQ